MFDYLIVGAGFAGSVLAERLTDARGGIVDQDIDMPEARDRRLHHADGRTRVSKIEQRHRSIPAGSAIGLPTFLSGALKLVLVNIGRQEDGCATSGKTRQETAAPGPVTVKDVRISDNLLEIEASGPFAYAIYKPSDPYRITIDIPDVAAGQFREKIASRSAGITEVLPSQTESPKIMTTMEVLLQSPSEVEPVYHGNILALRVKEGTGQRPDSKDEAPADPPGRVDAVALVSHAIAEEKVEVRDIGKAKEEPQFVEVHQLHMREPDDQVRVYETWLRRIAAILSGR